MRLTELIEQLNKKLKEVGDVYVLKTPQAPQIQKIKVRVSKIKPHDTYVLID